MQHKRQLNAENSAFAQRHAGSAVEPNITRCSRTPRAQHRGHSEPCSAFTQTHAHKHRQSASSEQSSSQRHAEVQATFKLYLLAPAALPELISSSLIVFVIKRSHHAVQLQRHIWHKRNHNTPRINNAQHVAIGIGISTHSPLKPPANTISVRTCAATAITPANGNQQRCLLQHSIAPRQCTRRAPGQALTFAPHAHGQLQAPTDANTDRQASSRQRPVMDDTITSQRPLHTHAGCAQRTTSSYTPPTDAMSSAAVAASTLKP